MEFRTLAAGSHWNKAALIDVFLNELRGELQAELACKQEVSTLNEAVHYVVLCSACARSKTPRTSPAGWAQFTSRVWRELLGKLNITISLRSGYHPQANSQVERVNQELGKFLCLYYQQHPEIWSSDLTWADYAQNSLCHAGMKLTTFECVLGYQTPLYPWNSPTSDQLAVEEWCRGRARVWEETHRWLCSAIAAYKRKADRRRGPSRV
ncbi:hypothetical protein P4O66_005381 [Electrophorus voltai]|uniref:Integrase catalytic domain-containing protein n=1 Tax=Electrophorus voltai TaxID=2609070 RepID=A0AAD8ZX82_9TELE|nr:hypothetical protein P4O66_005381 [Electrophorus voltai]